MSKTNKSSKLIPVGDIGLKTVWTPIPINFYITKTEQIYENLDDNKINHLCDAITLEDFQEIMENYPTCIEEYLERYPFFWDSF